jgi:hypothetical protein
MAETTTKAAPKKAATKPAIKAESAAKPVAAGKPAAAAKSAAPAKPATAAKPVAAEKPAAVAKPAEKKPAAVKKPAVAKAAKSTDKTIVLSDEQRYRMIAEAAYYRAESNQFKSDPLRDWIDAESDIVALLNGSK